MALPTCTITRTLSIMKERPNHAIENKISSNRSSGSSKAYINMPSPDGDKNISWDHHMMDTSKYIHEQYLYLVASSP